MNRAYLTIVILSVGLFFQEQVWSRPLVHPEYISKKEEIRKLVILEPEVNVAVMHKTFQMEIDLPEQNRVRDQIVEELTEILSERGVEVSYFDIRKARFEVKDLYRRVWTRVKEIQGELFSKTYGGFSNRALPIRRTIDEDGALLASLLDADALLFCNYVIVTRSAASEKRELTKSLILLLGGVGYTPVKASAVSQISVFDGTSGQLLWYNIFGTATPALLGQVEPSLTGRYWVLLNIEGAINPFPEANLPDLLKDPGDIPEEGFIEKERKPSRYQGKKRL